MSRNFRIMMMVLGVFILVTFATKPSMAKPATSEDYDDTVEVGLSEESENDNDELDPRQVCYLPMKRGHCRALLLRWRYDPVSKECSEFKYGGCAGNANNFHTKKLCTSTCSGI